MSDEVNGVDIIALERIGHSVDWPRPVPLMLSGWCSEACAYASMNYVVHGTELGSFLEFVFSNDLVHAYGQADHVNVKHMKDWASFLHNEVPTQCWGGITKVVAWQKLGGLVGMLAKRREEEQERATIKEITPKPEDRHYNVPPEPEKKIVGLSATIKDRDRTKG